MATAAQKKKADAPSTIRKGRTATAIARDPLDLNWRLYQQLGKLLDDMEAADRDETMTFPQRISAMIAVGRVQKMFIDLRKGDLYAGAGSAINKYSAAFAPPNATSGRDQSPGRPSTTVQLDPTGSDAPEYDGEYDDDRDDDIAA